MLSIDYKELISYIQKLHRCFFFPDVWKKSNIITVHKKGDKQIINY